MLSTFNVWNKKGFYGPWPVKIDETRACVVRYRLYLLLNVPCSPALQLCCLSTPRNFQTVDSLHVYIHFPCWNHTVPCSHNHDNHWLRCTFILWSWGKVVLFWDWDKWSVCIHTFTCNNSSLVASASDKVSMESRWSSSTRRSMTVNQSTTLPCVTS